MAQSTWRSSCCNPFELPNHSWTSKKNLRPVTKWMCEETPNVTLGMKICDSCRKKMGTILHSSAAVPESEEELDDEYIPDTSQSLQTINSCLREIGITPICKKKIHQAKYPQHKIAKVTTAMKKFIISDEQTDDSEMILQLKEKFQVTSSSSEKIQILTVLPKSWSLSKIQTEFGVSRYMAKKAKDLVQEKGILASPNPKPGHSLPSKVVEIVRAFYTSDEVSRLMPGKKDFVTVKKDGKRSQIQKRLVLSNLKECYILFKERYPVEKIGFSKFAELRPKQCVLPGASGTHTVCVCTIHQNVKLMFIAAKIHELTANSSQSLQTYHQCLAHIICNPPRPICYLGSCNECPGIAQLNTDLLEIFEHNMIENVTFKQWVSVDRSTLETFTMPTDEFVDRFCEKLNVLLPHSFIATQQASFYEECKSTLQPGELLVTADFSENYAFVLQDAAQGFHWNNSQATIHPFVVYYIESTELLHFSYVIISDCLHHDTIAVYLYQKKFISHISKRFNFPFKKIKYFSDGAASQYKNRKNFINLCHHKEDFGISAEWHFSATSHGKGACDGLGGTVKRLAARASLQRPYEEQIMTPRQLFQWASSSILNITFDFCSIDEYLDEKRNLSQRFDKCRTIPGTQKLHSYIPISVQKLETRVFSSSTDVNIQSIILRGDELEIEQITGFVTCVRSEQWWLGCVLEYNEEYDEVKLTILHPHGPSRSFAYPSMPDVISLQRCDILTSVYPTTTGCVYRLTKKEKDVVSEKFCSFPLP